VLYFQNSSWHARPAKGNVHEFFKHENQATPPALSKKGQHKDAKKADLLECLECCGSTKAAAPTTEVTNLDGSAMVNYLKPHSSTTTFDEYATEVINPYIEDQLERAQRVDVIWDIYREESIKLQCREKRGKGIRRRVSGSTHIPGNWQQFLHISDNKKELFPFLADHILAINTTKQVITTKGTEALSILPYDPYRISPCDQEADTRQLLHLVDAVRDGYEKFLLRTVDTDVVALAIAAAGTIKMQELWVSFGTDKHHRYIPAHEIALSLGPNRSQALLFFHAFSGCDAVSGFNFRGKKSAWDTWQAYDEATSTFLSLSEGPSEISSKDFTILERFYHFVVRSYLERN